MGKKLRNKTKKQPGKEKDDPAVHYIRRKIYFHPPTSNAEREYDKIAESPSDEFISRLPDDVLLHIIFLLPQRDAERTSFLSTRWRDLWRTGLEVETREKDGSVGEIFPEIGHFLHNYQELGLLKWGQDQDQDFSSMVNLIKHSRRLRLKFGHSHSGFLQATVTPNGALHLDFQHSDEKYEFPSSYHLSWEQSAVDDHNPSDISSMPSPFEAIRSLHLIAATNLTSEAVSSMLSELRFLDSLTIKECHGLRSLRINVRHGLSKLMIFDCLQLRYLHIRSDQIHKFRYRGLLPRLIYESCRREYPLGMEETILDFRGGPRYYYHLTYQHSLSLVSAFEYAPTLTFCRWTFEAMIRKWPKERGTAFPKLKELRWIDNEVDEHTIDALIFFVRRCPYLQKLYINIDPTSYSMPRTRKYRDQVFECERLVYLEVVQLEGVMKDCDKMLLATRLLDVVNNKNTKIIAKSHDQNRIWKFEEVATSLWSQPSAAQHGHRHRHPSLHEYWMKHYMFVEVNEEESGELSSYKHSHADW